MKKQDKVIGNIESVNILLSKLREELSDEYYTRLNLVNLCKDCPDKGYMPRVLLELGILSKEGKNRYRIRKAFDPTSRIIAREIVNKAHDHAAAYRLTRKTAVADVKPKRSIFKRKKTTKSSGVSFSILWGLFKFERR